MRLQVWLQVLHRDVSEQPRHTASRRPAGKVSCSCSSGGVGCPALALCGPRRPLPSLTRVLGVSRASALHGPHNSPDFLGSSAAAWKVAVSTLYLQVLQGRGLELPSQGMPHVGGCTCFPSGVMFWSCFRHVCRSPLCQCSVATITRIPQTGGRIRAETYRLSVLEARNPRSSCWQGVPVWSAMKSLSLPLPSHLGLCWRPLVPLACQCVCLHRTFSVSLSQSLK